MNKPWLAVAASGAMATAAAVFVLMLLLVKLMWAWIVPDLFPEAVRQNLVASSISWWTALKLALYVGLLAGFVRTTVHRTTRVSVTSGPNAAGPRQ